MNQYVVVDIESTGAKPIDNEIIEIGAVYVENDIAKDKMSELVRPLSEIPPYITKITGITDEMVCDKYGIEYMLPKFVEFARGSVLIGHNINNFDYKLLKIHASKLNVEFEYKTLDTLLIAREVLKDLPSRKLGDLCKYYGIDLANAHRAYDDAFATYELFKHLKNNFYDDNKHLFVPKNIGFTPPKISPITKKQTVYLETLCKKYNVTLQKDINLLSKSEGSRMIDKIISQHGR
ncbi:MAG: hypothetical protein ATN35_11985 [Epulopiscium sp. Nele67-Bin004]|nr:MAG: hypothetical protein ATN35_11985 [Epulopiscium sp. Nele67-Bin004]